MRAFPRNVVEIRLKDSQDFLKIRETLTRMGVVTGDSPPTLNQICHILHKRGRYYILHFKELQELDGSRPSMTEEDVARRDVIATLLSEWGLCTLVDAESASDLSQFNDVRVVQYRDKDQWNLTANYIVGRKPRAETDSVDIQE